MRKTFKYTDAKRAKSRFDIVILAKELAIVKRLEKGGLICGKCRGDKIMRKRKNRLARTKFVFNRLDISFVRIYNEFVIFKITRTRNAPTEFDIVILTKDLAIVKRHMKGGLICGKCRGEKIMHKRKKTPCAGRYIQFALTFLPPVL